MRYICLCVNVFISSVPSVPPAVKGNKEVREKSQGGERERERGRASEGVRERERGGGYFHYLQLGYYFEACFSHSVHSVH